MSHNVLTVFSLAGPMKLEATVSCEKAIWQALKYLLASSSFKEQVILLLITIVPVFLLIGYLWVFSISPLDGGLLLLAFLVLIVISLCLVMIFRRLEGD